MDLNLPSRGDRRPRHAATARRCASCVLHCELFPRPKPTVAANRPRRVRFITLAAIGWSAAVLACNYPSTKPPVASRSSPEFFTGEAHEYPPRISKGAKLPEEVELASIVANPGSYRDRRVTLAGCYTTDPHHGSVLFEPRSGRRGLAMFGGSDDVGDQPFDWMSQAVCGRFVGVIKHNPTEIPLKYLCPELCFVGEGTVESVLVSIDTVR